MLTLQNRPQRVDGEDLGRPLATENAQAELCGSRVQMLVLEESLEQLQTRIGVGREVVLFALAQIPLKVLAEVMQHLPRQARRSAACKARDARARMG